MESKEINHLLRLIYGSKGLSETIKNNKIFATKKVYEYLLGNYGNDIALKINSSFKKYNKSRYPMKFRLVFLGNFEIKKIDNGFLVEEFW